MVVRALNTNLLLNNGYKISKIVAISDEDLFLEVENIKIKSNGSNVEYYINEIIVSALSFNSVKFHSVYSEGVQKFVVLARG